jgi:hypothetical protein
VYGYGPYAYRPYGGYPYPYGGYAYYYPAYPYWNSDTHLEYLEWLLLRWLAPSTSTGIYESDAKL